MSLSFMSTTSCSTISPPPASYPDCASSFSPASSSSSSNVKSSSFRLCSNLANSSMSLISRCTTSHVSRILLNRSVTTSTFSAAPTTVSIASCIICSTPCTFLVALFNSAPNLLMATFNFRVDSILPFRLLADNTTLSLTYCSVRNNAVCHVNTVRGHHSWLLQATLHNIKKGSIMNEHCMGERGGGGSFFTSRHHYKTDKYFSHIQSSTHATTR